MLWFLKRICILINTNPSIRPTIRVMFFRREMGKELTKAVVTRTLMMMSRWKSTWTTSRWRRSGTLRRTIVIPTKVRLLLRGKNAQLARTSFNKKWWVLLLSNPPQILAIFPKLIKDDPGQTWASSSKLIIRRNFRFFRVPTWCQTCHKRRIFYLVQDTQKRRHLKISLIRV